MASNNNGQHLYGIFLDDLTYFCVQTATAKVFHSGDCIMATRTETARPECAVVLGFAATKSCAKSMANAYMREVGKLHNVENLDTVELGETQLVE